MVMTVKLKDIIEIRLIRARVKENIAVVTRTGTGDITVHLIVSQERKSTTDSD
jgi:hypothetical protein